MWLVAVLPMAFVVVAGPQLVSAVFLATTARWAASSAAYVAGAALSLMLVVTVAYIVGDLIAGGGSRAGVSEVGEAGLDVIILVLVAFLLARVYLARHAAGPPTWMGRLQEPQPRYAFELGAALLGLASTAAVAAAAAGLYVPRHGNAWWEVLPFAGLTLLLLALPALAVLALGERAQRPLARWRDWTSQSGWVVSELVLVFFGAVTVDSLMV